MLLGSVAEKAPPRWFLYKKSPSHPLDVRAIGVFWRRHPDLNRGVRALQALALPLGYSAGKKK